MDRCRAQNATFDLDSVQSLATAMESEIAANKTIVAYNSTEVRAQTVPSTTRPPGMSDRLL